MAEVKMVTVRMRGDTLARLREAAAAENRTLNNMIAQLVDEALRARRKVPRPQAPQVS
jgi:hypothetical protein